MEFYLAIACRAQGFIGAELQAIYDRLAGAVEDSTDVDDLDVAVDLGAGTVDFMMSVSAHDERVAVTRGEAAVQSVIAAVIEENRLPITRKMWRPRAAMAQDEYKPVPSCGS